MSSNVCDLTDGSLPDGWELIPAGIFRKKKSASFNIAKEEQRTVELYSVPSHETGLPEILDNKEIGSNKQYVDEGDVLLSKINPRLNRAWVVGNHSSHDKIASTEWIVFEKSKKILPNYLKYALTANRVKEFLAHNASGVGGSLTRIKPAIMDSVLLGVPSLDEQKDIVAKIETLFSELDKGIESLKTARQQLKAYRQTVLKHAFEGKLTEKWRQKNPDKLKSSMPEVRESQGMATPESWTVCCVKDVLVLGPSNGRSVKDRDGGFPVLRLTALKNGRIDVSEYKNGNWCREQAEPYIVKKGDFLLSRGNGSKHLVGRGGLVPEHTFEVAFPDTMVRLRVDQNLVYPDYFSLVWQSRVIRQQIEDSVRTTAGIYKINQEHIKGFSIPLPEIDEQKEIVNRLQEILSIVDKQESELIDALASSESLRQSILRKAFSGQLSIKIGSVK